MKVKQIFLLIFKTLTAIFVIYGSWVFAALMGYLSFLLVNIPIQGFNFFINANWSLVAIDFLVGIGSFVLGFLFGFIAVILNKGV